MPFTTSDGLDFETAAEANAHQATLPSPPSGENPVSESDITKPSSQQMLEDLEANIESAKTVADLKGHLLDVVRLLKENNA